MNRLVATAFKCKAFASVAFRRQQLQNVIVARSLSAVRPPVKPADKCGDEATGVEDEDEDEDMIDMFVKGPSGDMEWGGPTRGGKYPEPTRYGDWERKGRISDF